MENNSLGGDEIYLQRYTGSWNLLDTTLVSESATEIQYRASSPGLSLFAITGVKEVTTQEQEPEPEQQQQSPVCGNSIIESGEECDSSDFGGASCVTRGYDSGTLRCGSSCTFDTSECETTFSPGKQEQPQYDYTGIVIIIVILIIVLVAGSFYYKSLEKKKEKK
jgi:hypothetical protein